MTGGEPAKFMVPSLGTTNTRAASNPLSGCCLSDVIEGMLGAPFSPYFKGFVIDHIHIIFTIPVL